MTRKTIFNAFVVVFLVLFIVLWTIIAVRVLTFAPTDTVLTLDFGPFTVEIATLVGATLATATASALGFEIPAALASFKNARDAKAKAAQSKFRAIAAALGWPIVAAVIGYSVVGLAMVLIAALKPEHAPEFLTALALSWVGWIAGGFTAAIKGGAEED